VTPRGTATRPHGPSADVIESPRGEPPFAPQAIAVEDDTSHVLSADAQTLRDPGEHPIRLMTALYDTPPTPPGSVVVHGAGPWLMLAVVHDLDRDPSVEEARVAEAIAGVLRECAARAISDLAVDPLGTRHGRLPRARFRALLDGCLADHRAPFPERIWVPRD
jgi:hypothetical protein